jgi:hypothetical protein
MRPTVGPPAGLASAARLGLRSTRHQKRGALITHHEVTGRKGHEATSSNI